MANLNHSATLRIGGSIEGSFRSAVGSVSSATKRLQTNIATLKGEQREMAGSLRSAEAAARRFGLAGSEAVTTLEAKHAGLQRALRAVRAELVSAEERAARFGENGGEALSNLRRDSARLAREEHRVGEELRAVRHESERLGIEGSRDVARLRLEHRRLGIQLEHEQAKLRGSAMGFGSAFRSMLGGAESGFLSLGSVVTRVVGGVAQAGLIVGGVGVAAAGWFAKSALDATARVEKLETALVTLTGSEQGARTAFGWINKFADETPYNLEEVGEAFNRLRAGSIDPTNGTLRTLGDTAASMSKPLMDAVEAMNDAVQGQTERLREFGITAATTGDRITFSYLDKAGNQQEKRVKKTNKVVIRETLEAIWNEKYAGSMLRASRSWDGLLSTLESRWTMFQVKVMRSGTFDRLKDGIIRLLTQIDKLAADGTLDQWAGRIGSVFEKAIGSLEWLVTNWKAVSSVLDAMWQSFKDGLAALFPVAALLKDVASWTLESGKVGVRLAESLRGVNLREAAAAPKLRLASETGTKEELGMSQLRDVRAVTTSLVKQLADNRSPLASTVEDVSRALGWDALAEAARTDPRRQEVHGNVKAAVKQKDTTVIHQVNHVRVDASKADAQEVAREVKKELSRDARRERMASRG